MKRWLWQDIDIASLVFFRIIFGLLGFADLCGGLFYYHWYKDAYNPEQLQFKYYGFEWAQVLPEPFMTLFFVFGLALALAVAIGWRYRITAPLFAMAATYYFLLEKAHYLNHAYFFCWLAWAMAILPAWRSTSADIRRQPTQRSDTTPRWTLALLCFLMGVVYFFGGIAKLNPAWIGRAMPLQLWLASKSDLFLIGPLLAQEATAWFMAWGGVAFDLSIVFLLCWRRTRVLGFGLVLFFHITNHLVFNIGIFPFLSIALSALFFAPYWPRNLLFWAASRWHWLYRRSATYRRSIRAVPEKATGFWQRQSNYRRPILLGLGIVMFTHTVLPLRHHYFPGDVAWTEEGHRYAWRMMLRTKRGRGHFVIKNLQDGSESKARPSELGDKQRRKLWTHPDMILQYAHHLRDQAKQNGKDIAVYANIKVKLNDGSYGTYIDPEVDLAQIEWSFLRTSPWIMSAPVDTR